MVSRQGVECWEPASYRIQPLPAPSSWRSPEAPLHQAPRSHHERPHFMADDRMERSKSVDLAIAQIERQFGKGSIMKMKPGETNPMHIDGIPTGSIALDLALGIGGVPRGRIVEIYGPESSGKTTVALHIIAE